LPLLSSNPHNSYHQIKPSFEDYRLLVRDIVKYDRNLLASGEIYCPQHYDFTRLPWIRGQPTAVQNL